MNYNIQDIKKNGNTLVLLRNYLESFTKAERKVADIVLSQTEKVVYYSVTELAEQANVGEATIIRFSRKIGFKSYQDFKLALAKDLVNQSETSIKQELLDMDSPLGIAQQITMVNKKVLQDTLAIIDQSQLEKAIEKICKSRRIHFYGVGTSGITAIFAKYQFQRIGLLVDAYNESHFQAIAATTLEKGDVAFGISVTGSTTDTIQSLQIAKDEGATIISMTNHARSPITKISDIVLLSSAEEGPLERGAVASFISQLHVLDILLTGVTMAIGDKAMMYKEKTAKAVMNKIY